MLVFIYTEDDNDARGLATSVLQMGNTPIAPQLFGEPLDSQQIQESLAFCGAAILTSSSEVSSGVLSNSLRDLEIICKEEGIPIFEETAYGIDQPLPEVFCPAQSYVFRNQLGRMYRTYLKKNADYSPYNILGTGDIGLVTRLWDKMARIFSLSGFKVKAEFEEYDKPRQAKNESLDDSYLDLATYGVIAAVYRQGVWGK